MAEAIAKKAKEKERRTKKAKPKRVPLTDFEIVEKGTFTWLGTGNMGGLANLPRKPTKAEIFTKLAPDTVFVPMLEEYEEHKGKGEHRFPYRDLRQFWAVRAYIHGNAAKHLCDNFPLPAETFPKGMCLKRYNRILKLWICPRAVDELNKASEPLLVVGEVITIDEKHLPFEGESPYLRFVPNKDPQWGLWIMEASMKGKMTGLPLLINCLPVQQKEGPRMAEFFQSALARLPRKVNPLSLMSTVIASILMTD
jgi:hypothetical protein